MAVFQDARNGLDALLKDGARNLTPDDRDHVIVNAGRTFSRRFPRKMAVEVTGDGGFEYAMPTDFVDGASAVLTIFYPWSATEQSPPELTSKDWRVWDGPNGPRIRFTDARPPSAEQFLVVFTAPHGVVPYGVDVLSALDPAATVVAVGSQSSAAVADVEIAREARVYIAISAMDPGAQLYVEAQVRPLGGGAGDWVPMGAFNEITNPGNYVLPIPKERVGSEIRLMYTATVGTTTLEARVETEGEGTFTVPDHNLDAFNYLAASIGAQALADYYSHLVDSQLAGQTTDYEGKSSFWSEHAKAWKQSWLDEAAKIGPRRGASRFAQGEWDLRTSYGGTMLTHGEDRR